MSLRLEDSQTSSDGLVLLLLGLLSVKQRIDAVMATPITTADSSAVNPMRPDRDALLASLGVVSLWAKATQVLAGLSGGAAQEGPLASRAATHTRDHVSPRELLR